LIENSRQDGNEVYPIGTIVLTEEEQQECEETLRLFIAAGKEQEGGEEGEIVVKKEFAETFQRSIIAYTLMQRAERFLCMAGGSALNATLHVPCICVTPIDPVLAEKACVSGAKACSIFPFSMHFYDFGCILQQVGKEGEAAIAFRQFLGKIESDLADPWKQGWLNQRSILACMQFARKMI
jgi:hypothetical protein